MFRRPSRHLQGELYHMLKTAVQCVIADLELCFSLQTYLQLFKKKIFWSIVRPKIVNVLVRNCYYISMFIFIQQHFVCISHLLCVLHARTFYQNGMTVVKGPNHAYYDYVVSFKFPP